MRNSQVIPYKSNGTEGSSALKLKESNPQRKKRVRRMPDDRMVISESKFKAACKFFMGFYVVSLITVLLIAAICGYNLGKKQIDYLPYTTTEVYTVKGGDTLWSIAEDLSDGTYDIRRIIYEIKDINDLKGDKIYPWQELIIPVIE